MYRFDVQHVPEYTGTEDSVMIVSDFFSFLFAYLAVAWALCFPTG